jgi:hypothetical protein
MGKRMSSNEQNNAASMPSREEIIALLNQRKGIAHVWQVLGQKYGSPKGTYGPFVYDVISRNRATQALHNPAMNNPSYPDIGDNIRLDYAEAVCRPEDQIIPITAEDYVAIWCQIWGLRNDVNVLVSLLTSRPQR